MNGSQHKIVACGWGVAAAFVLTAETSSPYAMLVVPAAIAGSLLPDIDHDKTKIGRKRKFVFSLLGNTAKLILTSVVVGCIALMVYLAYEIKMQIRQYNVRYFTLLLPILGVALICFLAKTIFSSKIYKWSAAHRGLMHTLVIPLIIYWGIRQCKAPYLLTIMIGVLVGYLSHLFADMFTIAGAPVLFPITKQNIRLAKFESKDSSLTVVAYILAFIPPIVMVAITGQLG